MAVIVAWCPDECTHKAAMVSKVLGSTDGSLIICSSMLSKSCWPSFSFITTYTPIPIILCTNEQVKRGGVDSHPIHPPWISPDNNLGKIPIVTNINVTKNLIYILHASIWNQILVWFSWIPLHACNALQADSNVQTHYSTRCVHKVSMWTCTHHLVDQRIIIIELIYSEW